MQVIFIKDVAGIARRDELREVKDGYALNFLLPQALAVGVTPERLAALKVRLAAAANIGAKAEAKAHGWLGQLKGRSIVVAAKASEQGRLYASIGAPAVAKALREQLSVPVDPGQVKLTEHLKTVGSHQVKVQLGKGAEATVTVTIKAA